MDDWYALTRQEAAALVAQFRRDRGYGRPFSQAAKEVIDSLETWITEQESETVDLGASTSDGPESGVDLGRAKP